MLLAPQDRQHSTFKHHCIYMYICAQTIYYCIHIAVYIQYLHINFSIHTSTRQPAYWSFLVWPARPSHLNPSPKHPGDRWDGLAIQTSSSHAVTHRYLALYNPALWHAMQLNSCSYGWELPLHTPVPGL